MASILTNTNAMAALSTLRNISSNMEDTQARISSGLRVGSASDNAAYWSIATTMRSDNAALSSVQDALGLGAAKVDTAYAGMESVIDVVKEIKNKLVTAQESSADKTKIQGEITQLKEQLKGIVESASFSGENWLNGTNGATKSVVGSFVRESGSVSVKTIDYTVKALVSDDGASGILDKDRSVAPSTVTLKINDGGTVTEQKVQSYTTDFLVEQGAKFQGNYALVGADSATGTSYAKIEGNWVQVVAAADDGSETQELAAVTTEDTDLGIAEGNWKVDISNTGAPQDVGSILDIDISNMAVSDIGTLLKGVDESLTELTSAAAELGSISMRIGLQEDFAAKLSDSLENGIGRLVDADMNEESTRLRALQTQQQLAIQALSIANSDSQNILSLFR
ncbi:MAG: flagellin [Shinella sp.]|nr:flagellin [Shinella sp.]